MQLSRKAMGSILKEKQKTKTKQKTGHFTVLHLDLEHISLFAVMSFYPGFQYYFSVSLSFHYTHFKNLNKNSLF